MKQMKKKKLLALLLCAALAVSMMIVPAAAANYPDVTSDKWYCAAVDWATQNGIVAGYEDGTFRPDNSLTRAEFAVMMNSLLGLSQPALNTYLDVPATAWYARPVLNCVRAGIMSGYNLFQFGPDDLITREQAAVVLAKALGISGVSGGTSFADNGSIDSWAIDSVRAMTIRGFIAGYDDNTFRPLQAISRAQSVGILYTAMQRKNNSSPQSVYQKLAAGQDISILFLGDSIPAGSYLINPSAEAFPGLLENTIESEYGVSCTCTNLAVAGSAAYGSYVQVNNHAGSYDLVVICCGHNDYAKEFQLYYEGLLRSVRSRYPGASVISVLEHSMGQSGNTSKASALWNLCGQYGIPVADMVTVFSQSGLSDSELIQSDGLHPTSQGQQLYRNAINGLIIQNVQNYTGAMSTVSPVTSGVNRFDNFLYLQSGSFTRANDTTWTISLDGPMTCDVGIDINGTEGNHKVQIWSGGSLIKELSLDEAKDWGGRRFLSITKDASLSGTLQIVFDDSALADGFLGAVLNSK